MLREWTGADAGAAQSTGPSLRGRVLSRLVRGEEVDPQRIYFRCNPRMQASGSRWSWLSQRILIAAGRHFPDEVRLDVYVVT